MSRRSLGDGSSSDAISSAVCLCGWKHTQLDTKDALLCSDGPHWLCPQCITSRRRPQCGKHPNSRVVYAGNLWRNTVENGRPWKPWLPNTAMFPHDVTYSAARRIALNAFKIPGRLRGSNRVVHGDACSIVTGLGSTEIEVGDFMLLCPLIVII